ncbi:DUF6263 family protein [Planctomyces sp. SH-PL62]|uniref:DUF6263 family protein n=1 Tax=Planctomyces sp. SH-PL62 TaxID=1636152 RepID=UPI00078B3456|nr:DUF6263 family protein [Planctomyces sp. SH-PL62]AMV36430.1 hypothetical protein VT85_03295 [Planctomyces sp. SH-PL62]
MPHPIPETPTPRPRRLAVAALSLALAVGLGVGASARADAPLRWKFQKGETIRYALVQKTESKMKAGEIERGSTVQQTSDLRWIVDEVTPEGVATMTQIIDRVRVKLESAGQPPFEFDSEDKDKPQEGPIAAQIVPMFKALAGFECSLTMDPRGRIESVKIPQKTLDALRESLSGAMGNLFSEESMKNMITQSGLILPEAAVEKGKGWTDESTLPVQQLGTIKTDKTYTVEGPAAEDPSKVVITLDAKMTVDAADNPQISFEIKEQKNVGRFLFDAEKGRIASSHVEVKMVQLITAGANKLEQTMNNTMEMTLSPEPAAK